jgi:HD-like signal output (HDOD) protein
MIDLDSLVVDANALEPLPATVLRLLDLLASDDWNMEAVVATASLDAALTARIMRVANSAASSSATPVTTLEESTMRLGASTVVKLATGSAVRSYMTVPSESSGSERGEQSLWRHSVATALAADLVADMSPIEIPQQAFTVALLNDIGRIVLARYLDENTLSSLSRAVLEGNQNPLEAEREILGVDHAELGALIAERWQLPGLISESIRFHHTPCDAKDSDVQALCDVITVADSVSCIIDDGGATTRSFDHAPSCNRLGIDEAAFEELCEIVSERLESAMSDYE